MRQVIAKFLPVVALAAAFLPLPARAFEETHSRYLGAHDLFRVLRQAFPKVDVTQLIEGLSMKDDQYYELHKIPMYESCVRINKLNRSFLGVLKPENGEPVFTNPSPAFVKWYSRCLSRYIDINFAGYFEPAALDGYRSYFVEILGQELVGSIARQIAQDRVMKDDIAQKSAMLTLEFMQIFKTGQHRELLDRLLSVSQKNSKAPLVDKYKNASEIADLITLVDEIGRSLKGTIVLSTPERTRLLEKYLDVLKRHFRFFASNNNATLVFLPFGNATKPFVKMEFLELLHEFVRYSEKAKQAYVGPRLEKAKLEMIAKWAPKVGLSLVSWTSISAADQDRVIRSLVHHYLGPGIHPTEDALLLALKKVVNKESESAKTLNLAEAMKKLTFLICSEDVFLRY